MQRLINEWRLQETLALIPMEKRTFRKAVETAEEAETVLGIPDNPTNGDMIKAIFPGELLTSITSTLWWGDNMSFNRDWWNAPYKSQESEDK